MDDDALLEPKSSGSGNRSRQSTQYESINKSPTGVESLMHEEQINNLQCLMNLLKGYIGTGILAIPAAFKNGGLWIGFFGVFLVGILATYCTHLLVACSRHVALRFNKKGLDYGELMEEAILIGPQKLHSHSKRAKVTTYVFLALTQFGFCVAYIVFMSTNIKMIVERYFAISWVPQAYACLVALFLIPYLAITNLRILSFFSGIANAINLFGLSVILYVSVTDLPPTSSRPAFGSWSTFPLYFSIVVFTFEGIGVILPLENRMKTPREFSGWFGIINLGMTIVTCLIAAIGFFGYLKFGDVVAGSITLNLPMTIFYDVVRFTFVLAIFVTYGVQFYVPIEFLWANIQSKAETGTILHKYGEYFLRLFFLVLTLVLAAIVPHLDLIIALVGAMASTVVAISAPAMLDILCAYQDGYGRLHWKLIKNIIILFIGILALLIGTGTTLYDIVKTYQRP